MATIVLKVDDKIKNELDLIRDEEGLGSRTSTVLFLVKSYFWKKKWSIADKLALLDKMASRMDASKIPSARDQLKNLA